MFLNMFKPLAQKCYFEKNGVMKIKRAFKPNPNSV